MKTGLILAIAAVCLMTARSASATAIDFTGIGKYSAIRVNLNGYIYDGWGGELTWQWWDGAANAPGGVPTGYSSTFYAYCIDLLHFLTDPQSVTIKSTDLLTSSTVPYQTDAGAKAAWLFNQYAPSVHGGGGTNVQAAALQVAIWEALYDNSASLSAGAFTLENTSRNSTATNQAITTQAMIYLTGLYSASGGGYQTSTATWLDAATGYGQDQIIGVSQMPVPEPASILLVGTGLLGVARGIRRRRRGAAAPTLNQ